VRGLAKLEPLSRRRPLSSIEAGGVEARWRYAHRPSTRAGPFDAVIDVVEVEDCEAARAYFFFRRLVFFAPFFAADFVFVFRFFAMLPS
jgi:hypothetical protein